MIVFVFMLAFMKVFVKMFTNVVVFMPVFVHVFVNVFMDVIVFMLVFVQVLEKCPCSCSRPWPGMFVAASMLVFMPTAVNVRDRVGVVVRRARLLPSNPTKHYSRHPAACVWPSCSQQAHWCWRL